MDDHLLWRFVEKKIGDGEPVALAPAPSDPPVIAASRLRALLLGLGDDPAPGRSRHSVVITGATIRGRLDLADAMRADGSPLPALAFEACRFEDEVVFDHARVNRLSLRGSELRRFSAAQAIIGGTLDLSGVRSPDGPQGRCWIEIDGARIDGDLNLDAGRYRAPDKGSATPGVGSACYAVAATGVDVNGRILARATHAWGGVKLVDAIVTGELWFRGARLTAVEGIAFFAQSACFQSSVALDTDGDRVFDADGPVNLLGARIAGTCQLDGGLFKGLRLQETTIGGALTAEGATFRAADPGACFNALECQFGWVVLSSSDTPSRFDGPVRLTGVSTRGDFAMPHAIITGCLDLSRSTIGGHLNTRKIRITPGARAQDCALQLHGAEVRGAWRCEEATLDGPIEARGIRVGSDVLLAGTTLNQGERTGTKSLAVLDRARVGGDLRLGPGVGDPQGGLVSAGPIELDGIEIAGSLNASRCVVAPGKTGTRDVAFSAINATIGLDAIFDRFAAPGLVDLTGASVGCLLLVDLAPHPSRTLSSDGIEWRLQGVAPRILDDRGCAGWWPERHDTPRIDLDGFAYETVHALDDEAGSRRIAWLKRLVPTTGPTSSRPPVSTALGARVAPLWGVTRGGYAVQPYLHLAAYFRRIGRHADADQVLIAKLERDRTLSTGMRRRIRWLYGARFGHGFSPRRTTVTIIGYVCLGWALAWGADDSDLLVVNTTAVAPMARIISGGTGRDAQPANPLVTTGAVVTMPCRGAVSPLLYAIDTVLPIDLGEEEKCEPAMPDLGPAPGGVPSWLWRVPSWLAAGLPGYIKACYAVLGWIILSIAVLTYSGLLRREAGAE